MLTHNIATMKYKAIRVSTHVYTRLSTHVYTRLSTHV
jgi:hypothetical protein